MTRPTFTADINGRPWPVYDTETNRKRYVEWGTPKNYDPNCPRCRYSRPGDPTTHADHHAVLDGREEQDRRIGEIVYPGHSCAAYVCQWPGCDEEGTVSVPYRVAVFGDGAHKHGCPDHAEMLRRDF